MSNTDSVNTSPQAALGGSNTDMHQKNMPCSQPQKQREEDVLAPYFFDPFLGLGLGSSLMPNIFRDFQPALTTDQLTNRTARLPVMKLDISESEREFQLTADVPGLSKEAVKVELDADNVLHISTEGRRRSQREDKGEKDGWVYHRMERSSSSQHRAVKLPANADLAGIRATVEHGVLQVHVPKLADQKGDRRRIAIA